MAKNVDEETFDEFLDILSKVESYKEDYETKKPQDGESDCILYPGDDDELELDDTVTGVRE